MKAPRKKVAARALLLVLFTVALTSPLLTMFSTLLLPRSVLFDPVLSTQVVSLLGGDFGGLALQTEVAISASALLIFASNTALIGTYYVFIALSRMQFFPAFLQQRNTLRGTPHYAILLATALPIIVLLLVRGNMTLLGDMYAFGLLGAFTLTCLGLDIVRYRERKAARAAHHSPHPAEEQLEQGNDPATVHNGATAPTVPTQEPPSHASQQAAGTSRTEKTPPSPYAGGMMLNPWYTFKFYIGLLTTALLVTAWTTNLVAKPLATAFGGAVTLIGMGIASFIYVRHKREEYIPVAVTHSEEYLPRSTLAVLMPEDELNDAVIHAALTHAGGKPVVFLYLGSERAERMPRLFEWHDPYYDDEQAQKTFGRAEHQAQKSKVKRLFLYRQLEPHTLSQVWLMVHPHDLVIAAEQVSHIQDINPDRIRFEVTPQGKVAHLLKRW
jgi:hypothetical protein